MDTAALSGVEGAHLAGLQNIEFAIVRVHSAGPALHDLYACRMPRPPWRTTTTSRTESASRLCVFRAMQIILPG